MPDLHKDTQSQLLSFNGEAFQIIAGSNISVPSEMLLESEIEDKDTDIQSHNTSFFDRFKKANPKFLEPVVTRILSSAFGKEFALGLDEKLEAKAKDELSWFAASYVNVILPVKDNLVKQLEESDFDVVTSEKFDLFGTRFENGTWHLTLSWPLTIISHDKKVASLTEGGEDFLGLILILLQVLEKYLE